MRTLDIVRIGSLLFAGAAVSGLTLALWMENGPKMLASMIEAGLAWCL